MWPVKLINVVRYDFCCTASFKSCLVRCLLGMTMVAHSSLVLTASAAGQKANKEITVVDVNKAKAIILVDDNATGQLKTAAAELARYIRISTGKDIKTEKISKNRDDRGIVRIIIKTSTAGKSGNSRSFSMSDEFSITFPDERTIVINGATDWGTEFGVDEFLERYVGVRWLMPGPDGEFVPIRKKLSVPINAVREKPAFDSRLLSGLRGAEQDLWAHRNRMHGQIQFHHNLLNLFPPAKYKKIHPEFFPLIRGKRFLPEEGTEGWQPCFTAPGIVEEAVKNICDYFAKHPEERSYSLGVNDGGGYCECDACLAKHGAAKNFLDLRDVSDTYFEWANAVVEAVLKKYPDKWFGCLAYGEIAQAPQRVRVHPRIVPFLTYDRMKWVDDSIEKQGRAITESWSERAGSIGWYDYIYGTPYLVPRVYFHKMADYYRYGHDHGVRAMYSEAYPNWGEGPKLYIALMLQRNPYQDVDKLLGEWYEKCVGREAAPYLKAYYDLWEGFWTKKAPKSKWFSTKGQYLAFSEAGYLDLIEGEITESRNLLEKVMIAVKTPDQKKRSHLISRAFEYYEASVLSYQSKKNCTGFGALSLGTGCDLHRKMKEKRFSLINEFEKDPVLLHPIRFDKERILQ